MTSLFSVIFTLLNTNYKKKYIIFRNNKTYKKY